MLCAQELPLSVDNSLKKYFPPIFTQIGGSCAQASSVGYMFTYEMNRLLDRDASTAVNRFSYLFTWNFINEGQDVGSYGTEGYTLAYSHGLMTEADFPSQSSAYQFKWASGYEKYINSFHYKVAKYEYLDMSTEEDLIAIKRYLYNKNEEGKAGGILSFSSAASGWGFESDYQGPSQTGYKCLLTKLPTSGAHAMTIVGYDDTIEYTTTTGIQIKGAFIVVNSYGTWYHDRGHYYLPYYFFTHEKGDGILGQSATSVTVRYEADPKIVFKVGVTYSSRNDLSFSIGVADKPYTEIPQHDYQMFMASNQGGDYPMQGSNNSSDMEIAFNFSSFVERLDSYKEPKFFLTINRKEVGKVGEGKITHFSVWDYRDNPNSPKEYVCSDIDNTIIQMGKNIFGIPTTPLKYTSASKTPWLDNKDTPLARPIVIRTAKGNYAKIAFLKYDKSTGKVTFQYYYAPDGSTNLSNTPQ